ncbi:hypothetical protein ACFVJM_35305 [Streptomyces virginiae]|uniref:hypothetical protein n=1 Tax=Streptomyces virginiae TaxID=1961 RepID=UPI00363D46EB
MAFHLDTGQLDLRPGSPAYATQLRLITAPIVAEANSAIGADAVRTVRILPADGQPASIHQARVERRRQAGVSHAAALRVARAERALRSGVAVVLPQPAPLRTTA